MSAVAKSKTALKPKPVRRQETVRDAAVGWRSMRNGKGRGVFAHRALRKGEVVEIAPVVPIGKKAFRHNGEAPDGYVLMWNEDVEGQEYAMALGYVMLYNHSDKPNIGLESQESNLSITVTALRDIKDGEELCWNYNCDLWFDEV